MAHAVIGTIAMAGMLLQILLLAFMRPASVGARTPVGPGYVKAAHYVHRYLGYLWMFMGLVACEMGTHISSVTSEEYLYLGLEHENEKYAGGLIAALTATAFVTVTMVFMYDASATTAVATDPYHGTKSQEQEIVGGGDVETPTRRSLRDWRSRNGRYSPQSVSHVQRDIDIGYDAYTGALFLGLES